MDNIEPKLKWLQQQIDLNDAALSNITRQHPSFFAHNVNTNLKPTLHFYINALGGKQEALTLVTDRSNLFSYLTVVWKNV